MDRTFQVKESFIREAHKVACRDWKKKLEAAFPIFAPESMWYTHKDIPNWLCHLNLDGSGYGFDMKGEWKDNFSDMNDYIKRNCTPATAEQVESALRGEAIKRGFVLGASFTSHVNCGKYVADVSEPNFWNKYKQLYDECRFNMSMYSGSGGVIYRNGEWAKVIKNELQVGKWYKSTQNASLFFVTEIDEKYKDCKAFGFNFDGDWRDEKWEFATATNKENHNREATQEEVMEALSLEANRRGFIVGAKFIDRQNGNNIEIVDLDTPHFWNIDGNNISTKFHMSMKRGSGGVIYRRGVWADLVKPIITEPTPEEITRVLDYLKSKQLK